VTASIGLVHDEAGAISPDAMMRAADMACFMAKEKGRNRVHPHREEDQELLDRIREMNWVQRIHQALNEDRFCLYGQEIVALTKTDHPGLHLEVLIRMRDESGVLVPPSSFLPAAERFGLVKLIDRWVVRTAFRALSERGRSRTRCRSPAAGSTSRARRSETRPSSISSRKLSPSLMFRRMRSVSK
jgi:diguanylate cyclase/phosphodiesterase with PAS/PAC sensor(s)